MRRLARDAGQDRSAVPCLCADMPAPRGSTRHSAVRREPPRMCNAPVPTHPLPVLLLRCGIWRAYVPGGARRAPSGI